MATENPDNMLLDCYQRYIGSLDEVSEVDVYTGSGLTMAGVVLSLLGWAVFLYNETTAYGMTQFYTVRELAIVAVALGVPVFFMGVVTMLLGNDRVTAVAGAGLLACLGAILLFFVTYPAQWDAPGQFNAPLGVSIYGVGVALLLLATGAAYSCRVTGALQIRETG